MKKIKNYFRQSSTSKTECNSPISENYELMDSKELLKLSPSELCKLIYQYDTDVIFLNSQIELKEKTLNEYKADLWEIQDQFKFLKETNEVMSKEMYTVSAAHLELKALVRVLESQLDTAQEELDHKERLLKAYESTEPSVSLAYALIHLKQELAKANSLSSDSEIDFAQLTSHISRLVGITQDYLTHSQQSTQGDLTQRLESLEIQKSSLESERQTLKDHIQLKEKIIREFEAKLSKQATALEAAQNTTTQVIQSLEAQTEVPTQGVDKESQTEKVKKDKEPSGLQLENQTLAQKLKTAQLTNDKLLKNLIDLKRKQEETRIEVLRLSQKQAVFSARTIKQGLDSVYRQLLLELKRTGKDYYISADAFLQIEKELNKLIMLVYETCVEDSIEDYSSKTPRARNSTETFPNAPLSSRG